MATVVELEKDNLIEKGYVGFSWTTFFFGFFVPALRFDIKNFFLLFSIQTIISVFYIYPHAVKVEESLKIINLAEKNFFSEIAYETRSLLGFAPTLEDVRKEMLENTMYLFYGLLLLFFISFAYALFYNRMYTKKLLKDGYKPVSNRDRSLLKKYKLIV